MKPTIPQNERATVTRQLDLFAAVGAAFGRSPDYLSNADLYRAVEAHAGVDLSACRPIGVDAIERSPGKRAVRWVQQTLKHMGLVERLPHERGAWRVTEAGRKRLTPATPGRVMIACSTDLGIALWARHEDVFRGLSETVHLVLTSPPYPIAKPRSYGGPTVSQYTDFVCESLEPLVRQLAPGGSIALNIANDVFERGSPARSLYRERLVIALHERLGLWKMDELIWHNPCRPPGPVQWASLQRVQLNATYEPVLWMTNDPHQVRSRNSRVLLPHSAQHRRLLERGGEARSTSHGDGAWRLRAGRSFSQMTSGTIPRNVITMPHTCIEKTRLSAYAREIGLPVHGATMPQGLAEFLIGFLTAPGDLVVDHFGGWFTTAAAAQNLGRRWITTEQMGEYAWLGARRLDEALSTASVRPSHAEPATSAQSD